MMPDDRTPRLSLTLLAAATLASALLPVVVSAAPAETRSLGNDHIQIVFARQARTWRLARLARSDGSDALDVTSDEFEVLLFDGQRVTVDDYHADGDARIVVEGGARVFETVYRCPEGGDPRVPASVTVTYRIGTGPFVHKEIRLGMREGQNIDRLQVLRFSTAQPAERGGEGQPVFVGNWFFGLDYPGFHSRHSDGFVEPDFRYKHPYTIDLDGADRELSPRRGLVTCFHFPGAARRRKNGSWDVVGKRAVMGLSRKPGESAELALLDYIDETRLPPRSYLHFNNWYSDRAKNLDVAVFADDVAATLQTRLRRYGARLDAMVPDNGWQNGKTFTRIYEPKPGLDLAKLRRALARVDTGLGLWVALDGTKSSISRGLEVGYRPALADDADLSHLPWLAKKRAFFDLLDPKYQRDLRESLRHMIAAGGVDYIKHDFNHCITSGHLSWRHAREACLDVTLELLAYERRLNPRLIQNFTNGAWFSPWWFQHAHVIWMMSGDSGGNGSWPQLSLRDGATTYRDAWLYQSFNRPAHCVRPLVRIADLMTHGILFTKKKPFTDSEDTLRDWSDYVVMYFARGTTLKELYIDPELLDENHWRVLGMTCAWAQAAQHRLLKTVLIGGDCSAGEVYGYVSWVGNRAILTARNPGRRARSLQVPFDTSVYFRGEQGRPFRARVIYPFVEEMPWALVSGRPFSVGVPGDSTWVLEITRGTPRATRAASPPPLPTGRAELSDGSFSVRVPIPDEDMARCDLLVQVRGTATPEIRIDGEVAECRLREARRWTLSASDLREHRGEAPTVTGHLRPRADSRLNQGATLPIEVWLVADRRVAAPAPPTTAGPLPFPISQHYRRQTSLLLKGTIPLTRRPGDDEATTKPQRQLGR